MTSLPPATAAAGSPPPVMMYARERPCPDVDRARTRLTELGIPWQEIDVDADAGAADLVQQLTGRRRVPTLLIGERVLVEPTVAELDEALASAGFTVARQARELA